MTEFSANDKFVKELAEAIPLGEITVFCLEGKCQQITHLMAEAPSKGCFFISFEKSAVGALRAALATWKKTGSR